MDDGLVRSAMRALVAAALASGLAACGTADQPRATGQLVVSIGIGEPKRLIPSTATESNGAEVVNALFTPLVEYDEAFRPVELAAESITTSDNRVWTIRLRDGWTFHNGERVTADTYINAWNAGAYGPNAHDGNYFFDKIEGYRDLNPTDARRPPAAKKLSGLARKDDLTFEVTLSAPYVNFKSMLGYTAFLPLPLAAFASVADNTFNPAYEQAPIGQGPFKMKGTWQHDQQIEMERYEAYTGPDKPSIAGVLFKIYLSQTTQYQDLLANQLDVVPIIPLENMATVRDDLGPRFRQSPSSTFQFLSFPTFDKRFAKVEIRRAISMALDRDEIIKTIYLDSQSPARSFVSPIVPGYRPNTCGEACEFNPARAKALFDAHGGAAVVGGRIQIAYNVDGGHKPWVDAACNQIRRHLGVECAGNPQPKFAELLTLVEKKQPVGMFRMGWVFDYPAMENYLGPLYTTNGSSNYYGYSNREFDRLVAEGDRAATPDAATTLYQQAEDLLARDMPVVPMRFERNNFGHSTRVRGVEMDLFRRVVLSRLEAAAP